MHLTVLERGPQNKTSFQTSQNNWHVFTWRQSLREMAERLADKYEEAKEKQEDIVNR